MTPSGIREEYLFPKDSVSVLQAAHSAGIHKYKNKTTTESSTQCSCDVTVVWIISTYA